MEVMGGHSQGHWQGDFDKALGEWKSPVRFCNECDHQPCAQLTLWTRKGSVPLRASSWAVERRRTDKAGQSPEEQWFQRM